MNNELDIFKSAWRKMSDSESHKGYSAEQLKKIVKKSSNSEMSKIRRKFQLEWGLSLALSVFAVLFIYFVNPNNTIYSILFLGLIFIIGFIPYISILSLNQSSHPDLKNYLKEFILRYDKLVKQYVRMAAVLVPFVSLGGFLLGFHSAVSHEEWIVFFTQTHVIVLVIGALLLSFGGCWLQDHYFKWFYGNNIQRLHDCLEELDKVEE